jgi:hypothetical protein
MPQNSASLHGLFVIKPTTSSVATWRPAAAAPAMTLPKTAENPMFMVPILDLMKLAVILFGIFILS